MRFDFPNSMLWLLVCGCVLFGHALSGHAQTSDSLIRDARALMLRDPQAAADLLDAALTKARESKAYHEMVPLLHQLAIVAVIRGDHDNSRSLNQQAMDLATLSGDHMLIANALTKIAKDYRKTGNPDTAVVLCMEAIEHYNAASAPGNAWACHTILGNIAHDTERPSDAERHYFKAWEVVQTLQNPKEEFIVAGILQHFLITTGNTEKYAVILEELLQRYPYFSDDLTESNAHYHALLRTYAGNQESVEALTKSIAMHRQLDHQSSLLASLTRLGKVLTMNSRYSEGFDTLKQALRLAGYSIPARLSLYYMLYENREAAGDPSTALEYYRHYQSVRDSINSQKALDAIRELEIKYQTREKEFALLQEQERTRKRTSQRNLVISGAGLILWFSLFGILFFWNRARLQRKLAVQTDALNQHRIQQLEQEKKLLAMSSMIEGQEAERKRIAQDLHDGLGGLLSSVKAQLNLIQHHVSQLESSNLYHKANTLIDNASTELRRISHNMMPSSLSRLGLEAALEDLCASLRADHRLDVDLQIFGLNQRLGETTEIMLYRIVQELCNNVIKHAQASRLLVQINKTQDELFLIVEDNGIGIDPRKLDDANGIGMKSIGSRVKFLNGTLDIGKSTDRGTCITVQFPIMTDLVQQCGSNH